MTHIPSLYDFKGHNIRVVEIDNSPWFVAADVCKALSLTNTANRVSVTVSQEYTKREKLQGQRGLPTILVSEAGLYTLVMRSDKPEAKVFQDWVTDIVLPAIRKDGGYIKGEEKVVTGEMSEEELVFKALDVMRRKIDRLAAERDAMHKELFFVSVAEYAALNHAYFTQQQKSRLSVRARKLTLDAGEEITKSPRVVNVKGTMIDTAVNVYKRDILDRAAKDLDLFAAAHATRRDLIAA
jgi:prophage antirepressor-like protein